MMDPALNEPQLPRIYAARKRIHIPGFLTAPSAEALADMLKANHWAMIYNVGSNTIDLPEGDFAALPAAEREQTEKEIEQRAALGFQFRYRGTRIFADRGQHALPASNPLSTFGQFINTPEVLEFFRKLTGHADISWADAQATCYRPGDFLTGHDDAVDGQSRRAAYVLNLTPVWRAEWGGLLLFHAADGHIDEGLSPSWNAINVFSVPQMHSVSQVSNFARVPRLAITGWFHA